MRVNSRINLSRAVRREAMDESLTLYNPPAGMRLGGRWAEGTAVTSAVTAAVQNASGEAKQLLPELMRSSEAIEVFALSELRPIKRAEGKRPSELEWRGARYSVEVLEDWSETGSYWWALCSRVSQ